MGRSVPAMGKAAAAQQSLALSSVGGAVSARALQAIAGVRGAAPLGVGNAGSVGAVGDTSDAPRGKAGLVTGNRPGFAAILARMSASRVTRGQSETRDAAVASMSVRPNLGLADAPVGPERLAVGAAVEVAAPKELSSSRSSTAMRRDASSGMRSVGRLSRALDRARQAASPTETSTAGAMAANPPSVQVRDNPSSPDGSGSGAPRTSIMTPAQAAESVDVATARIEAAVATGNASVIAQAIAEEAGALAEALKVLLGQAAVALTGDGPGSLDLGMLLASALDGTIPEVPTLTGTAADQSSLAGLVVALRQMGAALGIDGPMTPTSGAVTLDGAGVFGALAAALTSASDVEVPVANASAIGGPAPVAVEVVPVAVTPVATTTPLTTPATATMSNMEGVPVIAVAEAGIATVVPIVVAPSVGPSRPSSNAEALAMVAGVDGPSSDSSSPTLLATAVSATAAVVGSEVSATGDEAIGAPVVTSGSGTTGVGGMAGAGMATDARARSVDGSVATSAAASGSPVADLHEQVSPVLIRLARLTGAGESRQFTLRLSPENLGPLSIRLTLRQGALGVDFTASSPEARKALEAALPQLRAALGEAGLRLERLDVGLRERGDELAGRNAPRQGDQGTERQAGQPDGQNDSGTGDGGRSWSSLMGQFQFDQDGQPFDLASQAPVTFTDSAPTRAFVRVPVRETVASITRALGVQSRASVGLGAYGGRRAVADVGATVVAIGGRSD